MEFLSEKAIALWGPFAFIVIILIIGIVVISRYFVRRQKHWDDIDENRTTAFVGAAKEFSSTMIQMHEVLIGLKDLVESVNINMVKINAKNGR